MGAWGTGPFDNDEAADFAGGLDDLSEDKRADAVWEALTRAVEEADYLDGDDAAVAVAAAALVAAQCPGGDEVDSVYGPKESLPQLPDDLRSLAAVALDRVLADDSELKDLWEEAGNAEQWHEDIARLHQALVPTS
jgi:hypothetical protein